MRKRKIKLSTKKKKEPRSEWSLMNFKITTPERRRILAKAKKYAGGNLSGWLRQAGLNHDPVKLKLSA